MTKSNEPNEKFYKERTEVVVGAQEMSIDRLLKRYFFNENYYTSCAVVLQKSYNNTIEQYTILEDKSTIDNEEEYKKRTYSKRSVHKNSKPTMVSIKNYYIIKSLLSKRITYISDDS